MKIDPEIRSLIPPLAPEERKQLEVNLQAEGQCRDALVVWDEEGILLDGHNRHEICTRLGIPFQVVRLSFPDRLAAMRWMIANQRGRRNLTPFARCEMVLPLEDAIREQLEDNLKLSRGRGQKGGQNSAPLKGKTRAILADLAGVSHDSLARVKYLKGRVSAQTLSLLRIGEVSIHAAYKAVIETQIEALTLADPAKLDDDEPEDEEEPVAEEENEAEETAPAFPCSVCGEVFPVEVRHCRACGNHVSPWDRSCVACRVRREVEAESEEERDDSSADPEGGADSDQDSTPAPPVEDRSEAADRWIKQFDKVAADLGVLLASIDEIRDVARLTRGWPNRAILRLHSTLAQLVEQAPGILTQLEEVLHEEAKS